MAGTGTTHLRPGALVRVEHLVVDFPVPKGVLQAVSDISLDILPGETLGLVGESGSGKSTTGRAIVGHVRPTGGSIVVDDRDISRLRGENLRRARVELQMVFQDPISSINPRRPVEDVVGEGLRIWKRGTQQQRQVKVREVMEGVGLSYEPAAKRRRSQFSGGQCQRISIARALVLDPTVVVCDEPVSALDVSVQAQILNLLRAMKARYGLTMLFIAHDLAVVKHISDRVAVMYLGKLCEVGPPGALYRSPRHPYTALLLSAIPGTDPGRPRDRVGGRARGEIPSPISPPSGCRFRTRCPRAEELCGRQEPELRQLDPGHFVACHFPLRADEVASR